MKKKLDNFNNFIQKNIISKYIEEVKYDIYNSLHNCYFFTRDVINWAKKNGIKVDYVYMPLSEEYRKKNKIGKDFGGKEDDSDWEDHVVPMINGQIIDFTYTPNGVSQKVREKNTTPPLIVDYDESLFKPSGLYGKFGYTKPEINTEYGKPKDINEFID